MDKNKIAVEVFNKLAKAYQEKFMDVNLYGDTFDFFCTTIKKQNAEILELACGPGNITRYLLNKRPDFKITGIDLAPNMIGLAKINNPAAEFQVMDCRDIGSLNRKYDAIMCGFCLPYLSAEETVKLISDAAKIIDAGGLFYLSTMEDEYSNSALKRGSGGDEIFMHYYPAVFLIDHLVKNGFEVEDLRRKEYLSPDGTTTTDLVINARKRA